MFPCRRYAATVAATAAAQSHIYVSHTRPIVEGRFELLRTPIRGTPSYLQKNKRKKFRSLFFCSLRVGLKVPLFVVVVVVFFTLTDRASTIPSNIRGCQSGTWSAGREKIRGASTKLLPLGIRTSQEKESRGRRQRLLERATIIL